MSFLESLIGPALSFLGGERRNDSQAAQAEAANVFSAQQFASRYQTTTADMAAAGLNPMLAYSQGASGQPTGQQAQIQDTISPAVSAYQASGQNSLMRAQTEKAQAETRNIDADTQTKLVTPASVVQATATSAADADLKRSQIVNVNAELDKIREQTRNIYQDTFLKQNQGNAAAAQVDLFKWTIDKISHEVANLKLTNSQISVLTTKYLIENHLLTSQINQAENMSEAQRSWYMRNIAPYLPDFLKGSSALKNLK